MRTRQFVPSISTALRNLSKAKWTETRIDSTNSCTSVLGSANDAAQYNTMRVHILGESGDEKLGFVVKGKSVKFKGFTAVYSATVEENDEDKELDTMPDLNEGEHLNLDDVGCEQKFTKPPARYNDATLVKALEENGIGRPSTYASIISVIAKREYTEKQQKSIVPTQLGEAVCEYMEKNFPDIMNLNFTARLGRRVG